jgi:hypothetical protein
MTLPLTLFLATSPRQQQQPAARLAPNSGLHSSQGAARLGKLGVERLEAQYGRARAAVWLCKAGAPAAHGV